MLLGDADAVLRLRPGPMDAKIGVVGLHPSGSDAAIEVRAFFGVDGATGRIP